MVGRGGSSVCLGASLAAWYLVPHTLTLCLAAWAFLLAGEGCDAARVAQIQGALLALGGWTTACQALALLLDPSVGLCGAPRGGGGGPPPSAAPAADTSANAALRRVREWCASAEAASPPPTTAFGSYVSPVRTSVASAIVI